MWFHGVVFLAATALFSSVNCKATGLTKVNTPKTPVIAPLLSAEAPTQRMLRIDVNSEDGDEARVFDFKREVKGLLRDKKFPDYVLRKMNEDVRMHDLEDGVVGNLDKYVAQFNKKHGERESTVGTLTAYYRDETTAVMIQHGIRSSNRKTKKLAEKLEAEQYRNWFRDNKSPRAIFRALNLKKDPAEAFRVLEDENYAYEAFQGYLKHYNRHHNTQVTVYQVFKDIYGGRRSLALMIQHALQTDSVAVKNMENEQFRYWDEVMRSRQDDVRHEVFKDRPSGEEETILRRYDIFLRHGPAGRSRRMLREAGVSGLRT